LSGHHNSNKIPAGPGGRRGATTKGYRSQGLARNRISLAGPPTERMCRPEGVAMLRFQPVDNSPRSTQLRACCVLGALPRHNMRAVVSISSDGRRTLWTVAGATDPAYRALMTTAVPLTIAAGKSVRRAWVLTSMQLVSVVWFGFCVWVALTQASRFPGLA